MGFDIVKRFREGGIKFGAHLVNPPHGRRAGGNADGNRVTCAHAKLPPAAPPAGLLGAQWYPDMPGVTWGLPELMRYFLMAEAIPAGERCHAPQHTQTNARQAAPLGLQTCDVLCCG